VSIPEPQEMGNCTVPKLLLSFVDSCPDFIFVLSLRGLFLHVSTDSCRKTLEYEPDDMIGHKIAEFVHPSDLVSVMRDLRNCSTEGSINFICRIRRKKSGYFYMEMNGRVFYFN
jgi:PAS domain S-box-containing protein